MAQEGADMAISVNDSISTERALIFAKLSELAYATSKNRGHKNRGSGLDGLLPKA
jgi:hypothetical protein